MRNVKTFGQICTFPEDIIISFLDLTFYYDLNNKNKEKNRKNTVRKVTI